MQNPQQPYDAAQKVARAHQQQDREMSGPMTQPGVDVPAQTPQSTRAGEPDREDPIPAQNPSDRSPRQENL